MNNGYNSNQNLKTAGVVMEYTEDEIKEYIKCKQDPIYFIEKYIKIVTLDHGLVPFKLHDYQKRIVLDFHNHRKNIVRAARQIGKTTTVAAYFTYYILFNDNKTLAILANKAATAREILSRIQLAYESLPKWLQQ
jgi:phage terminase large subunit-like protein